MFANTHCPHLLRLGRPPKTARRQPPPPHAASEQGVAPPPCVGRTIPWSTGPAERGPPTRGLPCHEPELDLSRARPASRAKAAQARFLATRAGASTRASSSTALLVACDAVVRARAALQARARAFARAHDPNARHSMDPGDWQKDNTRSGSSPAEATIGYIQLTRPRQGARKLLIGLCEGALIPWRFGQWA